MGKFKLYLAYADEKKLAPTIATNKFWGKEVAMKIWMLKMLMKKRSVGKIQRWYNT